MIPVLIVPVLNRPELFDEMVASVDVKVGTWFIVDNGDVLNVEAQWGTADWRHIRPGHNLGVAMSWNLGLKANPRAPWWFITNFDMAFAPGDLGRLADAMDLATGPTLAMLEGFSAFALNSAALDRVGYFDENLHPAYYEDNDFARRAELAGVSIIRPPSSSRHVGSATIYGDQSYRDQNHETFRANKAYYINKWGGQPGEETVTDAGAVPVDPRRIRLLAWRLAKDVR